MKVDQSAPVDGPLDPREHAARAEREGYAGIWLSEVKHDPFLGLALAATVTERAELGTSIALAFARNPMSMAALANDLQGLSGGRLLLGLGAQVKAHITRRFGMPWSHPAARMREYVLAMRAIWQCWHEGARLDFRGDFYDHTLMTPMFVPGSHPHGAPPVLLAGVGEAMTEVAGEVCDGFVAHGFTTERYLREVTLPALRRGRERAGGSLEGFQISGSALAVTGRTEEELAAAAAAVRSQIAFYGSTPAYRGVLERHGWGGLGEELHALSRDRRWTEMGALIDDDVLRTFAAVGTPGEVAAELVQRFGDLFTRFTLYTPYPVDPAVVGNVAAAVRRAVAVPA
ncbi:TIGR03617 family F420-dependent LLM class oxidoreductase [Pseudonocardia kunmingensis]|uniref:Putative F420-dependent oxidoreductase n=1 Tax=Pseudonocardia kunmingensis TaxID=630975 RepID=A0A543DQ18_9PSEU|nr:TIGR03617 family F420-dependent LLM class oxidoreductase [Pseudonocardia kunmingensis]TQM11398.1 putative F420-dependent oxidoreductase [Pseudonocardia kunmingensis]